LENEFPYDKSIHTFSDEYENCEILYARIFTIINKTKQIHCVETFYETKLVDSI